MQPTRSMPRRPIPPATDAGGPPPPIQPPNNPNGGPAPVGGQYRPITPSTGGGPVTTPPVSRQPGYGAPATGTAITNNPRYQPEQKSVDATAVVPPRPATPPATGGGWIKFRPTTPPPPPPPPPPPNPGDLRGDVYTPGDDPRLRSAQSATDAAGQALLGANRSGMQAGNEERYRSIFGNGAINPDEYGVNPSVGFDRRETQVTAGEVDPNVRFRGIDTNVGFDRMNTSVNGRSVNSQVARGASVDPMESARTAKYGQAQDEALAGLNGPDRTALAMQKLKDFDAVSNEQRFNEERDLGRNISKFGRGGLQANADNFGDIQRRIAGDRGRLANDLARSVAEGDINDRFRRVDTTSGLRSMESGIDAGMRGERRQERDYGTGLDERNVSRAFDDRDYATGLDERNMSRATSERDSAFGAAERNMGRSISERDAEFGAEERNRGRQFDERGFRASLDTANMDRGLNERNLETALNERNVGRQQDERDTRLGIATGNQDRSFRNNSAALDYATGQTDRGMRDHLDRFDAAGSLEDRVFGQGRSNRDEMRGERAWQEDGAQRGIDNRVRQRQLEEMLKEAEFRRDEVRGKIGGL